MLIYSVLPNPQSIRMDDIKGLIQHTQRFGDAIVENSFDCLGSVTARLWPGRQISLSVLTFMSV